jgi:hypothetical protein
LVLNLLKVLLTDFYGSLNPALKPAIKALCFSRSRTYLLGLKSGETERVEWIKWSFKIPEGKGKRYAFCPENCCIKKTAGSWFRLTFKR